MSGENRLIVISDIHGMLWKLQELFNKLSLRKDDKIIFLGDYIDRGEHSRKVIDYIIDLKSKYDVITLLGNHEKFALEAIADYKSPMAYSWMMNGGYETLKNYDLSVDVMDNVHGEFLRSLKLVHEEKNYIFVHGYLNSDLNIEEQDVDSCIWSRFNSIKPHKSGKIVVCGHTIYPNVIDMGYKICIDTGSFKSDGRITAMIIEGNGVRYVGSN
jgi:serine/threonine protein phosphatase 1